MRFRTLTNEPPEAVVSFRFNGQRIDTVRGKTIAAALLASGQTAFRRSARSGAMHGPYCLMGACFECMVEVEGAGKVQACMTEAQDGMDVKAG